MQCSTVQFSALQFSTVHDSELFYYRECNLCPIFLHNSIWQCSAVRGQVSLECRADGDDPISMVWRREGRQLAARTGHSSITVIRYWQGLLWSWSCSRGGDYSELFLGLVVLDAFFHNKMKIIFKILKNDFWPPLPGVWKFPKTHYRPKNENHRMGVFDSSNEAFWCTDYNAKNPSSLRGPISLKIKKKRKKNFIFKKWSFWAIFLDFFQNGTLQSAGVFTMAFAWKASHGHVATH